MRGLYVPEERAVAGGERRERFADADQVQSRLHADRAQLVHGSSVEQIRGEPTARSGAANERHEDDALGVDVPRYPLVLEDDRLLI
jgi:hypothetical protein